MKKLFTKWKIALALLVLAGSTITYVNVSAMPDPANAEFLLNRNASGSNPNVLLGYQVISNKMQLLKCVYDFAVVGGASTAPINLKAPDGANCRLPNKAIVWNAVIDVITQPGTFSNGIGGYSTANISVSTGQAAAVNDIKATAVTSGYSVNLFQGTPAGSTSTAIKLTAAREPVMKITTNRLSTGKFNVFIEYLLSN